MDALLVRIAERITSGADPLLSPSEALELARLPESATLDILSVAGLAARKPAAAFTCGIINAKSGRCPENCAFCAQSAHHQTDSPVYPLYDTDTLLRRAEELAANNVDRFGIVTSGTAPSDRDFDALCESALRIGREVKIGLCASLGLLTPERAARLREAGFTSYHHNLETSASHFPSICTTHAYEQDLETVRVARSAGFRVCSCGIFGLGGLGRNELLHQRILVSHDPAPFNRCDTHVLTLQEQDRLPLQGVFYGPQQQGKLERADSNSEVGRALPCRHETRAASHTALAARGDRGRPLREETQRSRPRAASPV